MAKIEIPEGLRGKELTKFLLENKAALISQKKSMLKYTDCISAAVNVWAKPDGTNKAMTAPAADATSLLVKVVANACNWCDSQWDVLIPNSAKKTITDRRGKIPHLHDHVHMLGAQIGDVEDIYLADIPLRDLGLNKSGTTQCIVFETLVQKAYNEQVFNLYKAGKVKQHSIGLCYVRMDMAINDEQSEKEYDFWNKYYPDVINKDFVDELGFFFVIQEIMLLENSAVLFGSNELTPTLEAGKSYAFPTADPALQNESGKGFNLEKALKTTRFLN